MVIQKELISSFDPFNLSVFRCPVCSSNEFTELHPYGGVWCNKCNAGPFTAQATCDGINKIAVQCTTEHVHKNYKSKALPWYGAVIWSDDERITWLAKKNGEVITIDPLNP